MPLSRAAGRRSPLALLLACLTILAALAVASPAANAADRAFSTRFSANDSGDIVSVANTVMTCPTSAGGCPAAQANGTAATTANNDINNNFVMGYVDVDGDSSTFNSSSADLALPKGATVLFAGLYWGGETAAGSGGAAAPNAAARNTVKLKAPGGSYQTITASTVDDGSVIYQGFADVTSKVQAAGNGTYTVGNLQTATGYDRLGGWSLVIAYRDSAEPVRNLNVFDGLKSINGSGSGTIDVAGFKTPPTGAVNAKLGFISYEGDLGLVGDGAALNGYPLSDAAHAANNFFNSHISRDGKLVTDKSPNYANQLGFDSTFMTPDNSAKSYLGNGASSARITLSTAGDVYAPGVVTVAIEIYAPKIDQTKTVVDDNGGNVEAGDTLTYTIRGTNSGQDGTSGFSLRDPLPVNTSYVPGSLVVDGNGSTDGAGDDRAESDGTAVTARFGVGSSATAGGNVRPGDSYSLSFKVKVSGPLAPGTVITNTATASYLSQTTGTPLTAVSTADATVAAPDLTITKTRSGAALAIGGTSQYTLAVRNVGTASTRGGVTVTDPMPSGLTATGFDAPGWTCAGTTTVTCSRSDALGAGASYPAIKVNVSIGGSTASSVTNTATVSGGGDVATGNNSDADTSPVSANGTDVSITKSVDDATPASGDVIHYTLVVKNNGKLTAKGVVAKDDLPDGVTFRVVSGEGCKESSGKVTCSIGSLAAGDSETIKITAAVDSAGADGSHQLTDSKQETQVDLDPGQTRTVTIDCGANQVLTDGSVRVDAVDQGTGDLGSPHVVAAHGTSKSAYTATVVNNATGRAQAKLFANCLSASTTTADGHAHDLVVSDPVTSTLALAAGRGTATITCGPGATVIQPGYDLNGGDGRLVASQPTADGNGWTFTVDVITGGPTATFSGRCLSDHVSVEDNHTHTLALERRTQSVTVQPGQTAEVQVICGDQDKGIVADWAADAGLVPLGNDPRPKTRAFKFYNPTSAPLNAQVGLLCLNERTGSGTTTARIVNTATVSSTTSDPNTANNSDTAVINVGGTSLGTSGVAQVAGSSVTVRGLRASVRIACRKGGPACIGTFQVQTVKGKTVASRKYVIKAARTATVVVTGKALRTLKRARLVTRGRDGRKQVRTILVRHARG